MRNKKVNLLKNLTYIVLLLSISIIVYCCGDIGLSNTNTNRPDCNKYRVAHNFKFQNFYMGNSPDGRIFKIGPARNKARDCLGNRPNVTLRDSLTPVEGNYTAWQIITPVDTNYTSIRNALTSHANNVRLNYSYFPFFVCSIDSITNNNRLIDGLSDRFYKWTYIFTGKIFRNWITESNRWQVTGALLSHEIGHQVYIEGHEYHSGQYEDRCIMKYPIDSSLVWPSFTFCDNHACEIYNHLYDSSLYYKFNKSLNDNFVKNYDLEINITLEKDYFIVGEDIPLMISFKNNSGKPLTIENFDDNFIRKHFDIVDQNGYKPLYGGSSSIRIKPIYYTFKVDEEKSYSIYLLDDWGEPVSENLIFGSIPGLIRSGNYTIQYNNIYHNTKLQSNSISFTINKPDIPNQNTFELLKYFYTIRPTNGYEFKIDEFKNFVFNNITSVYVDQMFRCLLNMELLNPSDTKVLNDCMKYISLKPDSYITQYAIDGIRYHFEALNDSRGLINCLQQIYDSYINSKASSYAKNMLNNLNSK